MSYELMKLLQTYTFTDDDKTCYVDLYSSMENPPGNLWAHFSRVVNGVRTYDKYSVDLGANDTQGNPASLDLKAKEAIKKHLK